MVQTHRWPVEHELIPFEPGFPPGRRWLFLAPHPDDEVLGPGATLARAAARGIQVGLVVVTSGGAQGDPTVREAEAREAAAALGLPAPRFWGFADRALAAEQRRLEQAIRTVLAELTPDTVFVTSPVEIHPDHRTLAVAVQRVLRRWTLGGLRRRPPQWLVAYEVTSAMAPNLLTDAGEGWEAKRRAAACYASQLVFRPYDEAMEALGTFRRLTLTGVARAEAMHLLPVRTVVRWSPRRWAASMGSPAGLERRRR
ncbi:MAG: PIG-L family deacetylase [Thermoanaerobaculaceae bacterium]|nr:PIG-L family deacetylase [Thermoanaerobaculaceae bacterium]